MAKTDLEILLSRLAVSGRFDPAEFFAPITDDEVGVLSAQIALLCDEDLSSGRYRWILRAPARRQALERLSTKDSIRAAIAAAPPAEQDDHFARMLRAILREQKSDAGTNSTKEEARQAALQFARCVPALPADAITEALEKTRMRIALREREDAISIVLERKAKLFGRARARRQIDEFVTGLDDPRPLLVTGIGGVGKSTLLAAIIRRWTRQRDAPSVALLDFDRPALASGDPIEIVRELTRQLSIEWTNSKAVDKSLRQQGSQVMRDERARMIATREDGALVKRIEPEEQFSMLQSLTFAEFKKKVPEALREAPIVLMMDTFEVVGRQGPTVTERILDLEQFLREQAGFSRLRTIVSGRGIPLDETLAERRFGPRRRWVELKGLEPGPAAAFLAERDRKKRFSTPSVRMRAARALKGHPLALIVLERYARPRSESKVAELLRDLESDSGFSAEFAQTFLYARILERITDVDVKRLAHPGLVLRHVTPGLIRRLLAEPLNVGELTPERSRLLFEKLKGEYWLVETINDDLVRHRPDLRRLMLPGLFAGPRSEDAPDVAGRKRELKMAALAVSRAASDFYRNGPPMSDPTHAYWSGMGRGSQRAHEFYYTALSGAPAPVELTRQEATDIHNELGEDVDTMPAAWRALVKAARGEALGLDDEEISTLGGTLRKRAESDRIDSDLRHGETGRAQQRSHAEQIRTGVISKIKPTSALSAEDLDLIEKQVLAAFAEGDMRTVRTVGRTLVLALARGVVSDATKRSAAAGRLWESALWTSFIAQTGKPKLRLITGLDKFGVLAPGSLPLIAAALGQPVTAIAPKSKWRDWLQSLRRDAPPEGFDHTRLLATRMAQGAPAADKTFEVAASTLALGARRLTPILAPGALRAVVRIKASRAVVRIKASKTQSLELTAAADLGLLGLKFGPEVSRLLKQQEAAEQGPPVELNLNQLEKAYQSKELIFFPSSAGRPEVFHILRGLTPELHIPTSNFLSRKSSVAVRLSAELARVMPTWPGELTFGKGGAAFTARHALPLVQTADRCGLLRPALEYMAAQRLGRTPRQLLDFYDSITRRLFAPIQNQNSK